MHLTLHLPPPFLVLISGGNCPCHLKVSSCYLCTLLCTNDFCLSAYQCVNMHVNLKVWLKWYCMFILHSNKNTFQHLNCTYYYTVPTTCENSSWCVISVKSCSFIPSDSCLFSQWVRMILLCFQRSSVVQVSTSVLWLLYEIECVTCYMGVILSLAGEMAGMQ